VVVAGIAGALAGVGSHLGARRRGAVAGGIGRRLP
jgi:hypothetical protein